MMDKKRHLESKVDSLLTMFPVVAIIGPRQCGKSTLIWRNLQSFEKNSLKKVQKMPKGVFRDQGIQHHLLKIRDTDDLNAGDQFIK